MALVSHLIFALLKPQDFLAVAFADDFAIRLPFLAPRNLEILHDIFHNIQITTGLCINFRKTKLVRPRLLWDPGGLSAWRHSPWQRVEDVGDAVHLGFRFGRDVSVRDIWDAPISKLERRIAEWNRFGLNPIARIYVANIFLVTVLSYISFFVNLDGISEKRVTAAISTFITKFRYIPRKILFGLPEVLGIRARLRNPVWANWASLVARADVRDLDCGIKSNYEALTPNIKMHQAEAARKWRFTQRSNWYERGEELRVRSIYTNFRSYYVSENLINCWISEKLGKLDLLNGPNEINHLKTFFKDMARSLPQKFIFVLLRLLANGWPTKRRTRFWAPTFDLSCALCGQEQDDIQHIFGSHRKPMCDVSFSALKYFDIRIPHEKASLAFCLGCPILLNHSKYSPPPPVMGKFIYTVWLAHTTASRTGRTCNITRDMCYWSMSTQSKCINIRKETPKQTAQFTSLSSFLAAPTGVSGGRAPRPRSWLPSMLLTLGFTRWKRKAPSLSQVTTVLNLHISQCPPDSKEFKNALRWYWFLADYTNKFFQHLVNIVRGQLKHIKK